MSENSDGSMNVEAEIIDLNQLKIVISARNEITYKLKIDEYQAWRIGLRLGAGCAGGVAAALWLASLVSSAVRWVFM